MTDSGAKRRGLMVFGTIVLTVASGGFIFKLTEFSLTIVRDDLEGFGVVTIATYLVGLIGLLLLNVWAILRGHFSDLERPKFRMMELDAEYDRFERDHGRRPRVGEV